MTMHEALYFLNALRIELEESGHYRGIGAWPTRELCVLNLKANRAVFTHDLNPVVSFRRNLQIAKQRHWMAEESCGRDCHAKHLRLTSLGLEALTLLNENGCFGKECGHVEHGAELRFEKKVA
jgi:hypothetical protein